MKFNQGIGSEALLFASQLSWRSEMLILCYIHTDLCIYTYMCVCLPEKTAQEMLG